MNSQPELQFHHQSRRYRFPSTTTTLRKTTTTTPRERPAIHRRSPPTLKEPEAEQGEVEMPHLPVEVASQLEEVRVGDRPSEEGGLRAGGNNREEAKEEGGHGRSRGRGG